MALVPALTTKKASKGRLHHEHHKPPGHDRAVNVVIPGYGRNLEQWPQEQRGRETHQDDGQQADRHANEYESARPAGRERTPG